MMKNYKNLWRQVGSTHLDVPRDNGHWIGGYKEVYISFCAEEENVVEDEIGSARKKWNCDIDVIHTHFSMTFGYICIFQVSSISRYHKTLDIYKG